MKNKRLARGAPLKISKNEISLLLFMDKMKTPAFFWVEALAGCSQFGVFDQG